MLLFQCRWNHFNQHHHTDNYTVNENGAWVVNGVVQTQPVQTEATDVGTAEERAEYNRLMEEHRQNVEKAKEQNGGSLGSDTDGWGAGKPLEGEINIGG